jgi:HEAT repeat protein
LKQTRAIAQAAKLRHAALPWYVLAMRRILWFPLLLGALLASLAGCHGERARAIPDRDNLRCRLMLEVWAAQTNYTGGPFFAQDIGAAPSAVRETCAWMIRTGQGAKPLPSTKPKRLIAGLSSRDPHTQINAMIAIQSARPTDVRASMVAELLGSPHADVRLLAAETLGAWRRQPAGPALIERLTSDTDAAVRYKAAWALGRCKTATALDALIAALDDPDFDVVRQAAFALGLLNDPRALPPLLGHLTVADAFVQETIVTTLHRFATGPATDRVAAAFDALTPERRAQAERVILARGGLKLLQAIGREPEHIARPAPPPLDKKTVRALRDTDRLLALLNDPDAEIVKEAVATLGVLGDVRAAEPLAAHYAKADPDTQAMLLSALGILSHPPTLPTVLAALDETDTDLLRRALTATALVGGPAVADKLRPFLRHPDCAVRARAAEAFGLCGAAHHALFFEVFTEPSTYARVQMIWAFGHTGDTEACFFLERVSPATPIIAAALTSARAHLACANAPPVADVSVMWWTVLARLADDEAAVTLHKMWHLGKPETDENYDLGH